MKNLKKINIHSLNVITNVLQQIVVVVTGIIIPKIILIYFGSEVNGLVSSINQFLSYITLIEGGVSSVILASLYKPIIDKDENKISSVLKTSTRFYRKIGCIYIVYSLSVGLIYPIITNTGFGYRYILSLTIILACGMLIQYMLSISLRNLLMADNKVYIVSLSQIIVSLLNLALIVLSLIIFPNIHFLKFMTVIAYLSQPIIYSLYIKRHYRIDSKVEVDNELLKNRWSGFAINIAAFVHSSTDVVILTFFTDLKTVSIYSVYILVTNGLKCIISALSNAISPIIGLAYASGDETDLLKKMRIYEMIVNLSVCGLFSIAALLLVPFVELYTKGISDVNYIQPAFGVLMLLGDAIYLLKSSHTALAYSANRFKEITIPCYIEAIINISVSLVLVRRFGLMGVATGTVCAMIYRFVYQVAYTRRISESYSIRSYYQNLIITVIFALLGIVVCKFGLPPCNGTVYSWIWHGGVYSVIVYACLVMGMLLFEKNDFKNTLKFFTK